MAGHGIGRGQQCPASTTDRTASARGDVRDVHRPSSMRCPGRKTPGRTATSLAPNEGNRRARSNAAPAAFIAGAARPCHRHPVPGSGARSWSTPCIASQGPHGGRLRQTTADEGRCVRLLHAYGACPPGSGAGGPPERPPRPLCLPLLFSRSRPGKLISRKKKQSRKRNWKKKQ